MNREAIERLIYIRDNLCESVEDKVAIEIALTESDYRKWHDLEKNPNDLPANLNTTVIKKVLPNSGEVVLCLAYYNKNFDSWYELYSHVTILNVLGWMYVDE